MKILLTGAGGFTGRFFADTAVKMGHNVIPLQSNLMDKQGLAEEVASLVALDAVVHLAAISFVGHTNDSEFYTVNTVGSINLLQALAVLSRPPAKVLMASSANVYGNCKVSPIAESQMPAPASHYAMSKLSMEYMARTFFDRLPIVITRPFNYTGPGQALNFIIPKLVTHYAHRALRVDLGNLDVEREFNDVRMVCDAYLKLLEHGLEGETYNICSGKPYTLQHVMDVLTQLTGHTIQVNVNPMLVRRNELHRLCGDPRKFESLLTGDGGVSKEYSLKQTLASMLEQA